MEPSGDALGHPSATCEIKTSKKLWKDFPQDQNWHEQAQGNDKSKARRNPRQQQDQGNDKSKATAGGNAEGGEGGNSVVGNHFTVTMAAALTS